MNIKLTIVQFGVKIKQKNQQQDIKVQNIFILTQQFFFKQDQMRSDDFNQTITSKETCYKWCSEQHNTQSTHKKINKQKFTQQIKQIVNQNGQKWVEYRDNLQIKLDQTIDMIKDFIANFQQKVFQYQLMYVLPVYKQAESDQATVVEGLKKVVYGNYDKLTCDEVYRIELLIKENQQRKDKLKIEEQYQKVETKIGEELLERFYKIFTHVPRRIVEKAFNTKDLEEKVKTMMQEELKKLMAVHKPQPRKQQPVQRQKQIVPPKPQPMKKQQPLMNRRESGKSSHFSSQPQMKPASKKPSYEYEAQQSRPSYPRQRPEVRYQRRQDHQDISFVKIDEIRKISGRFHLIARVLAIDQEVLTIQGKRCVNFIAGDQTGYGSFVWEQDRMIKQGEVLEFTNCRVYTFRGSKQVQNSYDSQLHESDIQIKSVGIYKLSDFAGQMYNKHEKNIHRLLSTREQGNFKKPKQLEQKNTQRYREQQKNNHHHNRQPSMRNDKFRSNHNYQRQAQKPRRQQYKEHRDDRNNETKYQRYEQKNNRGVRNYEQKDRNERYDRRENEGRYRNNHRGNDHGARNHDLRERDDRKNNQNQKHELKRQQRRQDPGFEQYKRKEKERIQRHRQRVAQLVQRNNQRQNRHQALQSYRSDSRMKTQGTGFRSSKKITYIDSLNPDSEGVKIVGKVVKIISRRRDILLLLADQTGCVKCSVSDEFYQFATEGMIIQLIDYEAVIEKGHIVMKPNEKTGRVIHSQLELKRVNDKKNISDRQYQEEKQSDQDDNEYSDTQRTSRASRKPGQRNGNFSDQYD